MTTWRTTIDLKAVKAGDRVAYVHGRNDSLHLTRVDRLTPTLIVLEDDTRWNRSDGSNYGGRMPFTYLKRPEDPDILHARMSAAYHRAKNAIENAISPPPSQRKKVNTLQDRLNVLRAVESVVTQARAELLRLNRKLLDAQNLLQEQERAENSPAGPPSPQPQALADSRPALCLGD